MTSKPQFYGYPQPIQARSVKYANKDGVNPVFSGLSLVFGGYIVSKLKFLQYYLWSNAGFGVLRGIGDLTEYTERYDPTVIPIAVANVDEQSYTDPAAFKALSTKLSGRYHSVADYHALYLSGTYTPLQVAETLIPMIRRDLEKKHPHSVAFISTKVDLLLKAAKASTHRYESGKSLGILDGVPVTIKDEMDVAGYPTTYGRKANDKLWKVKEESAWPVKKWEEAGAIIIGKTNMHELGTDITNNNPNYGTPLNPYNKNYYTGGSSGGSAYSVSTGLVPISLGADGGGSIRLPASYCGMYGLKPSHGRVGDSKSTVTVLGPIAATISDLEVAYRVISRSNPEHPVASLFAAPKSSTSTRPKLLGIYEDWFQRADPAVEKCCRHVINYLVEKHGYEVIDIAIPYLPEGQKAHAETILSAAATHMKYEFPGRPWTTDLNSANKVLFGVGSQTPVGDYHLAQKMRNLLMSHLAFLYQKYPGLMIVTPTSPMAGYSIAHDSDLVYGMSDGNRTTRNMEYIWLANFAGCPAITCPVGYVSPEKGAGDLPVGFMAMGEWGSEDELLDWGREVEGWLHGEYPGGRQKPASWEDVIELVSAK